MPRDGAIISVRGGKFLIALHSAERGLLGCLLVGIHLWCHRSKLGPVAQLDRVLPSESKG